MSDDLLKRVRQALEPGAPRRMQPAAFDPAKGAQLLARAQAAIAVAPEPKILVAATPPQPAPTADKLVVSIDATGSRSVDFPAARKLQDRLIKLLPQRYDIALAAYGEDLHTFTPFTLNRRKLRTLAADIRCKSGATRLLEILARVIDVEDVSAVIYITDGFEECRLAACEYAETLRARGTRIFVLLDADYDGVVRTPAIFAWIAARTGGAVIPFDATGLRTLLRYLNGSIVGAYRYEL
jgi:hypothetical protein